MRFCALGEPYDSGLEMMNHGGSIDRRTLADRLFKPVKAEHFAAGVFGFDQTIAGQNDQITG